MFASFLKRNFYIALIIAVFVGLGIAYSIADPLFEPSDEAAHYLYIRHLIDERSLPIQRRDAGEEYQNHHPPLYYALGALATFWVKDDDLPFILSQRNPYWGYNTYAVGHDNKNQYLHGDWEAFPYRDTALGVHIVRWVSVLMGASTLLITYLIAREVFPRRKCLALGSLAFAAFNPQFIFISGAVNNDNLVTLLSALTILILMRIVKRGISTARSIILGMVLGAALLAKLNALFLLPLVVVAFICTAVLHGSLKEILRSSLIVLSLAAAISGWWFVRNWMLYGDPTAMARLLESIEGIAYEKRPSLWQALRWVTLQSYWAGFGWNNVRLPDLAYTALNWMVGLAAFGLLILVCKQIRTKILSRIVLTQLFILVLTVALFVFNWAYYMTCSTTAGYGRYLFPALPAISILIFLGLSGYLPPRLTPHLAAVGNAAMFAFSLLCLFGYLIPAYAKPPLLSQADIERIPHPLDINYEGKAELLGYRLDKERVRPGETLEVTLYWRCLEEMEENYSVFVQLFGREGQKIGQRDTYPGLGSFPTSQWKEGDAFADTYPVPISKDAAAPSVCRVDVGLYELKSMRRLVAFNGQGERLNSYAIARLKLAPVEPYEYLWEHSVDFDLADKVALVGYDLDRTTVKPGGALKLTLYWRALGEMDRDYTVFTHLVDEEGRIIAQDDSQPLGGYYPTSLWEEGEVIRDSYVLTLREDVPEGEYRIEVGMYLLETMERLSIIKEGEIAGDEILLGTVRIQR